MKKVIYYISIFIIIILSFSCETKKNAFGLEDEIYVIADSSEYEELKMSLESTFEIEINTPLPEKLFTLKPVRLKDIDRFKTRKNIIIVAPISSNSDVSNYINQIVDDSIKSLFNNQEDFLLFKNDLWAKNQLVTVLSAKNMQELEFKILKNKDKLLYAYQKKSNDRLRESLYNAKYERKEIEGILLRDFGWIIYVQADFKLAKKDSVNNFVWLRRSPNSDMERWIFVHWIENASPLYLNIDSILNIRNRLTEKYYRTSDDSAFVVVSENFLTTSEVNFNNRYAILTQGLWDLNVKGMGGPFINYTFYDEKSNRIYMLDGSIYAPKYYKRNLIQQVDVLLQSFMTKDELPKEKVDDLIESIDESVKY
ncbi:MAG: DUF4837 family protein [Ignavibacterium sp.]|nr:DUF4837 family protein [Ignavibacterium sp.]MCX7611881.1 DUF4837 family protein [Ignavibacterium sp.]MDW8375421.1 DUF4837 family protein [Ignavibacteriales bacterium]